MYVWWVTKLISREGAVSDALSPHGKSLNIKKQYSPNREKMQKADHGGLLGFNATIRKAQPGI